MLYDNIMVPYDGSDSAQVALEEAVRYAREDPGLTLRIVQIVDSEELVIDKLNAEGRHKDSVKTSQGLHKLYSEAIQKADERLHAHLDTTLKGLMNKVIIELIEQTLPGEQIVSYAHQNNCDLIVMGSRGLGGLRGMLGSVSSHVLREAKVGVLVIKSKKEDE